MSIFVSILQTHVGMSMKINMKLSQAFPERRERCKIELKEISHAPSKALFIMGNKRSVSEKQKAGKKTLLTDEGKASPDAGMKTRSYSDTAHKCVTWAPLLSNTDLDDNALQDTPKDAAVDDYRPEVDASDGVDSEDIVMGSPREGINLRTEIDWEGLKQHALLVHTKDAIINGKLLVDESQGYMASLQKRLADTTTSPLNAHASSKKCRGKTVALPMLNLDTTAGSRGLQLDESELMSIKEKEKMRILKNRLKQCTKCGEEVYCKGNKHAVHVPLNLVQIHAWACAIAHDTHGVTLDIPPDTGAFEDFHATRAERLSKTASVPTLATGPCPMDMTNATAPFADMMMGMASGFASMMHAPPVAQAPTVLSTATVANSSNSGGLSNMSFDIDYPEMEDGIAANLVAKDFLCIDEIAGMSESWYEGPPCSLSEGNANFVSKAVKKAVNRAQRDSLI
ncbi:hypothetical protein BU17DRAFT_69152 [Hysterangium stoloniferum]|nr:hypothetical protein BU17DRAFT_69152 [Hysterangium stoloniferum]